MNTDTPATGHRPPATNPDTPATNPDTPATGHRPPATGEMSNLILDRASELFDQKGYAAVAMREICAACGVTKPTLYYYFAD